MTGVISVCVCTAIISHMSIQQLEILREFQEHQQQQQINESELQPSSAQASSQNPTDNADVNVRPATNENTDNNPLQLPRPFGGKEINTVRIGGIEGTPGTAEEDSTAHALRDKKNAPIPTKRKITTTFLALKRSPKPGPGPAWVAPVPSRGKERSKSKGGTSKTFEAKKSMKKNSKKKSITSGKKRRSSETRKRSQKKNELVSSSKKRKSGSTSSPKGTGSLFVSSYAASGETEAKLQSESSRKSKESKGNAGSPSPSAILK